MRDNELKNKKILHLLASNSFSGAENVVCTIIDNMKDEYDMAYCSPEGPIKGKLEEYNIKYISLKKLSISEVKKVVNKYKPDIIHAHDFKASIIASFFYSKCKILSHIHKNDPKMLKVSLKSILYRLTSKRYNKVIGVSDAILNEYIFKKSIKDKYITLPNYVDKERIIKLSNEFKVNDNYDIFYCGRLSKEKNPIQFIEIIRDIKKSNNDIKAIMIGEGPLSEECMKLIKEYLLEKNIKMIGFQNNPYPYIKVSKIGIMPSIYEGFGLTAIESIILNKPVLNSGVGGLKDIFIDNKQYICNSKKEYVDKINNNNNNNNNNFKYKVDVTKYTNYNCFSQNIYNIYK